MDGGVVINERTVHAGRHLATAGAWFGYAEAAMRHLDVSGGPSEEAYRSFAIKIGGKMQVVQRLIRAARFALDVEIGDPDLGRALQTAPIDSVLALAGWARRDHDGALAAARRVVAGDIGLSGLRELEKHSRTIRSQAPGRSASDSVWQAHVAQAAKALITERHPSAKLTWSAKGWSEAPRTRLKIPGPIGVLKRTPLLHLAFDLDGGTMLISISAIRGTVPRRTTLTTQSVMALIGYCALGYRAIFVSTHDDECEAAREMLVRIQATGHAPAVSVERLVLHPHLSSP